MMRAALIATVVAAVVAACAENRTPVPPAAPDGTLTCLPDLDGALTAAELPIAFAGAASYHVSPAGDERTVDLAGDVDDRGVRVWDLADERADDLLLALAPRRLAGAWYLSEFPDGGFAVAADPDPDGAGADLDQILSLDDAGLWLHGVASREPDPPGGRTLLVYDEPVPLLRLPLAAGDAWTATGTIGAGELNGLPYLGTDTYDLAADGAGELRVPYVDFTPALRVRTRVVVTPATGGLSVTRRQVGFYFECFGEVARATSRDGETDDDFTTAAQLRRFAL